MGKFPNVLLAILMINQVHHAFSQQTANSWFVLTPQDTKILESDSTILYCQLDTRQIVENMRFRVTWSKNNEEIRFSDPAFPHYSMIGDPHSVQYYLLISDADVHDTAAYSCTVYENVETEPGTREWVMRAVATASLEVLTRPLAPECKKHDLTNNLNDTEFNYEGDLIELSCVGYLVDPSFTLTMKWKDEEIDEHNGGWVHIDDERIQERVYRFNTTHQDNGAHLQCILTSTEFPEYHESCDTVALNIIHEPKIEFVLNKTEVYENESLTVSCYAVSNPLLTTYHWKLYPLQVVNFRNGGRVLEIPSVSSDAGHLNITCEVWNDHGIASESKQVPVLSRSDATTTSAPPTGVVTEPLLVHVPTTSEATTQVPTTQVPTTNTMKPVVTKPDKTPQAKVSDMTTQKSQIYLHSHGAISTPMLAVIIVVPIIIIAILVLIFVFLYKTIKLSTKRSDDQIRVVYQDGATVINTQRTQRGRNLNLLVHPSVNEGATIPTEGMEAGAYSLPPPYSTTGLPSVMDNMYEDMASGGGNKTWGETKDKMFIDMP